MAMWGCTTQDGQDTSRVVAHVGSSTLTLDDARQEIPDFVWKQDSTQALKHYRDEWVRNQLMVSEAQRLGIDEQPEVQRELERQRQLVYRRALRKYVLGRKEDELQVTEQEAQQYYQANKDQFVLQEKYVRYRHLIASSLQKASSARQALLRGEEWPDVVRKYGLNAEATLRDSKRYFPISTALEEVPPLHRFIKVIGIREISPIRNVNGRYHFVQLMEEKPAGEHPELNWVMKNIQDWLRVEKRKRQFQSFLQNLYLEAEANREVKLYEPFPNKSTNKSNPEQAPALHDSTQSVEE